MHGEATYTHEEAYQSALEYFMGDELAARVWVNKYALKDSNGYLYEKTPDDMHWRLAREIGRIEKKYNNPMSEEALFELFRHFKYIVPQGSPMAGIGNPHQVASLSNCFVIGHEGPSDSYGGIMKVDQEQVQLMKRRGGVGRSIVSNNKTIRQRSDLMGITDPSHWPPLRNDIFKLLKQVVNLFF